MSFTVVHFADLGKQFRGVLTKSRGKNACCVINSHQPRQVRRWTWAHQLGHIVEREWVTRRGDEYSFEELARPREENIHDFFANEFAGALLVPQQHLTDKNGKWFSTKEISDVFDVSLAIAEWRLNMAKKRASFEIQGK